jgi:ParB/RepB/Spo0J family partition protein
MVDEAPSADYAYAELPHHRFDVAGNVRTVVEDEEFRLLVESIRQHGQLTPGTAYREGPSGPIRLISGHRRFLASKAASRDTFKVLVYDRTLSTEELTILRLTENIHRTNLKPLEEGRAYLALLDAFGGSARKLAKQLAVAHTTITRAIALCGLPEELQAQIEKGTLTPAHGRALVRLGEVEEMRHFAAETSSKALTAEELERLVTERLRPRSKSSPARRASRRNYTLKRGVTAVVERGLLRIQKGATARPSEGWIPILEALLTALRAETPGGDSAGSGGSGRP